MSEWQDILYGFKDLISFVGALAILWCFVWWLEAPERGHKRRLERLNTRK